MHFLLQSVPMAAIKSSSLAPVFLIVSLRQGVDWFATGYDTCTTAHKREFPDSPKLVGRRRGSTSCRSRRGGLTEDVDRTYCWPRVAKLSPPFRRV